MAQTTHTFNGDWQDLSALGKSSLTMQRNDAINIEFYKTNSKPTDDASMLLPDGISTIAIATTSVWVRGESGKNMKIVLE